MKQISILIAFAIAASSLASAATEADKRLKLASDVLAEIMSVSDKSIPQDLLNKAQCVIIVPGLKKGAFIVGGKFGRGFVTCRKDSGLGWSAPGALKVEGGSFGFQIGGAETDVVMLVLNKSGVDKLFSSKFTLGGDASVAAGPIGRESSADTDAKFRAEILTYSRSRGVFAGIALQGATLRPDKDADEELYGAGKTDTKTIVDTATPPPAAQPLLSELNRYSGRK